MYNNRLSARRGHFGLPSSFCLQMGRAHGSMFADDRPQTTQTAGRHAMIRAAKAYHGLLHTNSPGSHGVTPLTGYPHALMASLASPDALTYDLQPNPTSPSLTISYFILVPPVAHPSSTTHHHTLCTLRNVSHIAHCTIPHSYWSINI